MLVISEVLVVVNDDVRLVDYQPGDMTRYYVVATRSKLVPGEWCVAFPFFGSSYWAHEDMQPLHQVYVSEKWKVNGRSANEATATKMAEAIALALPRRGDG